MDCVCKKPMIEQTIRVRASRRPVLSTSGSKRKHPRRSPQIFLARILRHHIFRNSIPSPSLNNTSPPSLLFHTSLPPSSRSGGVLSHHSLFLFWRCLSPRPFLPICPIAGSYDYRSLRNHRRQQRHSWTSSIILLDDHQQHHHTTFAQTKA